jgi:hypothetical protein
MWPFLNRRQRLVRRALRDGLAEIDRGASAIELWTDHDVAVLVVRWPGAEPIRREFRVGR